MAIAVVTSRALWYLMRGSGVVSLILLTTSVVLGVTTAARWATTRWPRFVVEGLHKNVSLLAVVFLVVHIATGVIDGFVPLRWVDAVVPFISKYSPWWMGVGAIAFDMLAALIITSVVRVRLGYRVWRATHWLAYACWPVAVLHGLGAGSDNGQPWLQLINLVAVVAVVAAVCWRLALAGGHPRNPTMHQPRPRSVT